jgi:two-component system response regulator FixJ
MCTVYTISQNEGFLDAFDTFLSSFGIPHQLFSTAESFWSTSVSTASGCIVTEDELPGLNGIELARRLRACEYVIPVLLLSINPTPEYTRLALKAGVTTVLEKPFINAAVITFFQKNCQSHTG